MVYKEYLDPPSPQDISNVFASADLSSQSPSDSAKDKGAWHKARVICSHILSSRYIPDACSRALYIALNYKEIASILAVTGAIYPKRYTNAITRHEQKKKIFSHATSVGNKRKEIEDRIVFVISNIVSIVSSP